MVRKGLVLCVLLGLAICLPAAATADVVVRAESVTVNSPGSGYLDIYLETTGSNPQLGAYNVVVSLSGPAGVQFVSPFGQTTEPDRPLVGPATNLFIGGGSGAALVQAANDFGAVTMDDGDGLVRIPFTVDAGVLPGTWDVVISTTGTILNQPDLDGTEIAYSAVNGQIQVVPEPAALTLLAVGGGLIGIWRRRRRA